MSNKANPRRPESFRRYESRWGRRVGTAQRRPRPVARSKRGVTRRKGEAQPVFGTITCHCPCGFYARFDGMTCRWTVVTNHAPFCEALADGSGSSITGGTR
jgi:hypothetical protein